jgi:hypothetical protein
VRVNCCEERERKRKRKREALTANDAGLQRSLVSRLRGALLFADLLEIVINEGAGALGDAVCYLLQARGHGGFLARVESLPDGEVVDGGGVVGGVQVRRFRNISSRDSIGGRGRRKPR